MTADNFRIEWDEDGCYLHLDTEFGESTQILKVDDPEQLYDAVKGGIGPWLRERDAARMEVERGVPEIHIPSESANEFALFRSVFECDPDESGGYDVSDPKHPDFHSVHADIIDFSFPEAPEASR